jgi:hypothetical protein
MHMLIVAAVLAVFVPIMLAIQVVEGRSRPKPPQLTEDEKRRAAELQKAAVHEAALRAWPGKPQ